MLRLHEGGVVLFGVTPRGHGVRIEAREGASMNPKRRTRAMFLSTLLVLACLTAIPTASEASLIKWWQQPPMIGDPDGPSGNGFVFLRFKSLMLIVVMPRGSSFPLAILPLNLTSHSKAGSR